MSTQQLPPEGVAFVKIEAAGKTTAKTGKRMIKIIFSVEGSETKIYHNIVFLEDRPEITKNFLNKFFKAFPQIGMNNFNFESWKGHTARAALAYEEFNGRTYPKIKYFIEPTKTTFIKQATPKPEPKPVEDSDDDEISGLDEYNRSYTQQPKSMDDMEVEAKEEHKKEDFTAENWGFQEDEEFDREFL